MDSYTPSSFIPCFPVTIGLVLGGGNVEVQHATNMGGSNYYANRTNDRVAANAQKQGIKLEGVYESTLIGNYLYQIYQNVKGTINPDMDFGTSFVTVDKFKSSTKPTEGQILEQRVLQFNPNLELDKIPSSVVYPEGALYINSNVIDKESKMDTQVYIKYGVLMSLVQSYLILD